MESRPSDPRLNIISILGFALTGCPQSVDLACPSGAQLEGDVCRVACAAQSQCLLSEQCLQGLCVPKIGDTPEIALFAISPLRLEPGAAAKLQYVALFSDQLELRAEGLEPVALSGSSGTLELRPERTTRYTLVASRGSSQASEGPVEVTVEAAGPIDVFGAAFETGAQLERTLDDTILLRWETSGEVPLQLLANGRVIYSPAPELRARGVFLVRPSESTVYELVAEEQRRTLEVTLRIPPRIVEFSLSEEFILDEDQAPVAASWRVQGEPPLDVRLEVGDSIVEGLPAVHEALLEPPFTQNERIKLVVEQQGVTVESEHRLWLLAPELEPNTQSSPNSLNVGRLGSDQGADDEDWYSLLLPRGGLLGASLVLGNGDCLNDHLTIWSADGSTRLWAPMDSCPQAAFLAGLPAGDYLLKVDARSLNDYTLLAEGAAPGCGDGVLQSALGETCDDGNRSDLDGCARDCRVEAGRAFELRSVPASPAPVPQSPKTVEAGAVVPLPFEFRYMGQRFSALVVRAEGFVSFLPGEEAILGPLPRASIALLAGAPRFSRLSVGTVNSDTFVVRFESEDASGSIALFADGNIRLDYGAITSSPAGVLAGRLPVHGLEGQWLCIRSLCGPTEAQALGGSVWEFRPFGL